MGKLLDQTAEISTTATPSGASDIMEWKHSLSTRHAVSYCVEELE